MTRVIARARALVARKPDTVLAAVLGVTALLLYLRTVCPTVYWYDSAEYATAAATLGVPHPPGHPLYTLLGRLFVLLPVEPAYAVNLMSAVFGALAVMLAYLAGRRLGAGRAAAAIGAASLGASRLFWSQTAIAEVWTPVLTFWLGSLLLLLHGLAEDRGRRVVAAAGLAGLGLGIHLSLATAGLGLALLVLATRRLKLILLCLGAVFAGALIYLYIPLRASMGPELNVGDPSTWDRFLWFVTGGNYKNLFLLDYDFWERAGRVAGLFHDELGPLGLLLAAVGLASLARRRALLAAAILLSAAGNVWFFFDYGVQDLEVFFLPALAVLCLLAGAGAQALVGWLESLRPWSGRLSRAALLAYPGALLLTNVGAVDLSGYTAARDWGERVSAQLPRGALLLHFTSPVEWRFHAVFGNYFQTVLRRRRDVEVRHDLGPWEVLDALAAGRRLYLYAPVAPVLPHFAVAREGDLYRILGPRPPAATAPPGALHASPPTSPRAADRGSRSVLGAGAGTRGSAAKAGRPLSSRGSP